MTHLHNTDYDDLFVTHKFTHNKNLRFYRLFYVQLILSIFWRALGPITETEWQPTRENRLFSDGITFTIIQFSRLIFGVCGKGRVEKMICKPSIDRKHNFGGGVSRDARPHLNFYLRPQNVY